MALMLSLYRAPDQSPEESEEASPGRARLVISVPRSSGVEKPVALSAPPRRLLTLPALKEAFPMLVPMPPCPTPLPAALPSGTNCLSLLLLLVLLLVLVLVLLRLALAPQLKDAERDP